MKKFVFSLHAVLAHRERIEERKQQILGERQRELQAALDELRRLDGEFKHFSVVLRDDHRNLSTDDLRGHYAHLEYLDRCIVMQHAVVSEHRAAVEHARLELVEASKERKVIEKLKEKKLLEHRTLAAALEQKELDDANNRRHARFS